MSPPLLLDTHALLWWFADSPQLSPRAAAIIRDEATTVLVSAASAWEIATKVRLGKLRQAEVLVADIEGWIAREGFTPLPITVAHAARAGALPGPHRDPFDRMLIAQALEERCLLVSNESLFERYGVARLW